MKANCAMAKASENDNDIIGAGLTVNAMPIERCTHLRKKEQ